MPLQFHILKGAGDSFKDYSKEFISFEESDHDRLIKLAAGLKLPIISGMQNYYGQYKVHPSELSLLLIELSKICSSLPETDVLRTKLAELESLVNEAKSENLSIITFPD